MSKSSPTKIPKSDFPGFYAISGAIFWSLLIVVSLVWNWVTEKSSTYETARIEARTAYERDTAYRLWNANHDGVYVPVSEKTQPNPYLKIPERDIVTSGGMILTRINPAYMTRQVHNLETKKDQVKFHLTSLNPIQPANKPDPWETRALYAFENGKKEISSVEDIGGQSYMRLMRPLFTEKGCLQCHGVQGYKIGDIRGGLGVSVPMAPLKAVEQSNIFTLSVWHSLLWLVGSLGIGFSVHRLNKQGNRRLRAEKALEKARDDLEQQVEVRTSELVKTNKDLKRLIAEREEVGRKLLEHQQRLRALSSELAVTEERERRRFASHLHDGIGQNLALSLNLLDMLYEDSDFSNRVKTVDKMARLLEEAIQGTRTLTSKLSPPILYDLGFKAAVEDLADELEEQHGLEVIVDCEEITRPVDSDLDAFLYRAVRELLINVIKHAKASQAGVRIQCRGGDLFVAVTDDGVGRGINGPDSGISSRTDGFGLLSIRERVRHIGGRFEIKSHPGKGVSIWFSIPLNNEPSHYEKEYDNKSTTGGRSHGNA